MFNRQRVCFLALSVLALSASVGFAQQMERENNPVPWAYPIRLSADAPPSQPVGDELTRLPGSDQQYRFSDINATNAADWHPELHPPMPAIVSNGRPPVSACAFCHLANGQGKPENAGLAGLPAAYIIQQMADFRAGLRTTADPTLITTANMLPFAANATEEEIRQAAEYFASLEPIKWITVIEADTVPQTYISAWLHVARPEGGTEPLGQRILEMPRDFERTEWRDDQSGFIAYVPVGSLARGRALVEEGGDGLTQPCAVCHGENLQGLGPVPGIAGRSPTYLTRQIYDFKQGTRHGLWSPLMRPVVENLELEDIIAIIAYVSSLDP